MLLETLSVVRDFPRLHEITSVLIRYGWGDVVKMLGLANMLERAGRLLHWQTHDEVARLDLPVRLRLAMTELGPTYVKLGQVLASRVDVFPPSWIAEFEKLHSQVPPVPFETLRPLLEKVWRRPVEAAFAEFDPTPFAAASIAQVHRAKLPDGTPVVVKIRRPDIQQKIDADLRILSHLARLAEFQIHDARRYHPIQIVAQLKRSLSRELDLVKEARNIDTFARNFADDPTVHVPKVYWEYCDEMVNVQEELIGIPATRLDQARASELDLPLLARRGADVVLKMILKDGYFHADPHPGNVMLLADNRIGMMDFGMVGRISDPRREQITKYLASMIAKDEEGMLNILVLWAGDSEIDEDKLAYDVSEMVFSYDNLPLKDLKIGPLLSDATAIMRENNLSMPPDLTLLFKALISLEGLGHQLDPEFEMSEHLENYAKVLFMERLSPEYLAKRTQRGVKEMAEVLFGLPRDIARLFRKARRGNMRIDLDLKRLDHFGVQLNQAANRLTMGVLTASLVVGSSIIMTVEGGPTLFGLPLFGLVGFIVAFFNSVWILWSIWRSGRE